MKTFLILIAILKIQDISFAQNVIQAEYFIDSDNGFGKNTLLNITPSPDINVSLNINLSGILPGFHQLYIRTKDSDGKWSQTTRRTIEVASSATNVVAAEYFFNTDPGFGNAYPISFTTPSPEGSFSFNIPFGNIPDSVNTFYVRVKDNNNIWSITQLQRDSIATSLATSPLWSNINTWSNHKIPDINTIVILRHNVTVDTNAYCKSLIQIGSAVQVTVNAGKNLTIAGH